MYVFKRTINSKEKLDISSLTIFIHKTNVLKTKLQFIITLIFIEILLIMNSSNFAFKLLNRKYIFPGKKKRSTANNCIAASAGPGDSHITVGDIIKGLCALI